MARSACFQSPGRGRIAAGYDADFTIVDMKRRETITNAQAGSKAGWTPYDGREVIGWPIGTIIRGERVMWDGEIAAKGQGDCREIFRSAISAVHQPFGANRTSARSFQTSCLVILPPDTSNRSMKRMPENGLPSGHKP